MDSSQFVRYYITERHIAIFHLEIIKQNYDLAADIATLVFPELANARPA